MRGGSSIDNMLNGDAEKSMFTMANMRTGIRGRNGRHFGAGFLDETEHEDCGLKSY